MPPRAVFVAATIDARLGGIARSVPALAASLAGRGTRDEGRGTAVAVTLIAPRAAEDTLGSIQGMGNVEVILCDGFGGVKEELRRLTINAKQRPVFIYHAGVWNSLNHFVAKIGRQSGIPVITSIRSMLDPWALNHRKWKKRLAWRAYARRDLLSASAIHATAELEAGHIREALGEQCPPVIVVPNGVFVGRETRDEGRGTESKPFRSSLGSPVPRPLSLVPGPKKRMLFLSRIHPKKGVADLIRAFGELNRDGWELVIAGNDDGGYQAQCERLAAEQPNAERIRFHGPVSDTDKWELYRSADIFVLPSYSENFGIVVGEALGSGVPVITTTATPWGEYFVGRGTRDEGQGTRDERQGTRDERRGTRDEGQGTRDEGQGTRDEGRGTRDEGQGTRDKGRVDCRNEFREATEEGLWVVEPGVGSLIGAMKEVMALGDAEQRERGARGAAWIREQFTWEAVGQRFLDEVGFVLLENG